MTQLQYEQPIDGIPGGYTADATLGPWIFEVKRHLKDVRSLRAALYEAACVVASRRELHVILVLGQPGITFQRVYDEWKLFKQIVDDDLRERIAIVGETPGYGLEEYSGDLSGGFTHWKEVVQEILHHSEEAAPKGRSPAFPDILRVLLVHWLRRDGPISTKQLREETGFSYPTIASSLQMLANHVERGSNRSVGLRRFPVEEWQRLLVNADAIRQTRRYTVDGAMRPPEVMLKRLRELDATDITVGGVLGARQWYPGLDLAGTPRLDLTVHFAMPEQRPWPQPMAAPRHDFLRKLDPALRPAGPQEPAVVVVHSLLTPETFSKSSDGILYANEAECLLDLQEARLEMQAVEFLNHLTPPLHSDPS